MQLEVIKQIREHGLEAVVEKYGLKARWSADGQLVCLGYGITSDMQEQVCQECRGLILDKDFNYVALPYHKFFNYNEPKGASVVESMKLSTGWVVEEKLDGSLITLYYYGGKWRVSTTGMPEAEGPMEGTDKTFAQMFWQTLSDFAYDCQELNLESFNEEYIYMFELCTKYNKNVVDYGGEDRVTLLGVRRKDGTYLPPRVQTEGTDDGQFKDFYIPNCRYIRAITTHHTLEGVINYMEPLVAKLDGSEDEGYVLHHLETGTRLKMKCPDYCEKHRYRHNITVPRHLVELGLSGQYDDVYGQLSKENQSRIDCIQSTLISAREAVVSMYNLLNAKPQTDKEFAERLNGGAFNKHVRGLLFSLRKGKTIDDTLKGKSADFYCEWLNIPKTFDELDKSVADGVLSGR